MDNIFYIKIPFAVFRSKKLTAEAKLIYGYLLFKQYQVDASSPWIKTISNDTGLSYGTVRRYLRQLRAAGFVDIKSKVTRSASGRVRRVNHYRIKSPWSPVDDISTTTELK